MTGAIDRHVALAVVGEYLPHAAAMVCSVLDNGELLAPVAGAGSPTLTFHLLQDGTLPHDDVASFSTMVEARGGTLAQHVVPDEWLAGLPTAGFTGKGSWYRVFLPDLLPHVDRLLYLDVDLLVMGSLIALYELELGDALIAAVTNVFEDAHRHRPTELGLVGPEAYFNAGVLLMDLAGLRAFDASRRLCAFGRERAAELLWRDQDALNVVLGPLRVELAPRWNCMNSVMDFPQSIDVFGPGAVDEARSNPAIRHFEGPSLCKPWHYLADPAAQRLYAEVRARTPWPALDLEDETLVTRVIRRLPPTSRRRSYVLLVRLRRRLRSYSRRRTP